MISRNSRVLLVVHHPLFSECLIKEVGSRMPRLLVDTAESTGLGLERAHAEQYELVLFDTDAPQSITPDQVRLFKQARTTTHVVVVGKSRSEEEVLAFLEAGASDYRIVDTETLDDFCDGLAAILEGGFVHNPERTRALFARLQTLSAEVSRIQSVGSTVLTDREMEILRLVAKGQSNKEIAKHLHLSLHTVKNHVHNILEKLQVSNRREAVHMAYHHGWIKIES